ncbi:MAG: DUF4214 domain-containing protein [Acidimicrobiales bacterium]|nr:DUF4214 domain-containing protein [Acidimicrobiales bacterium]
MLLVGAVLPAPVAAVDDGAARHAGLLVPVYEEDVPPEVQVVVDDVMHELSTLIAFNPAGPAQIQVAWSNIASLGLGGPVLIQADGINYPAALADTLFGGQHARGGVDGFVTMGSGHQWYFGLDGKTPSNQFDFRSAFAHELIHALGFTLETSPFNGGVVLSGRTTQFDRNLFSGGRRLIDMTTSAQAAAFEADDVWFDVGGGRLYPVESAGGSGQSHFGFAHSLVDNEPGAMMYGGLLNGLSRQIDGPTLGALAQIGYPLTAAPASLVTASLQGQSLRWSVELGGPVAPPSVVRIEQQRRGVTVWSADVSGALAQYTLPAATAFDAVRLTAISSDGVSSPAIVVPVSGANTIADATSLDDILRADDYRREHAGVLRLYWAFFNREPDLGGARYWLSVFDQGASLDAIANAFAGSSEFRARYGALNNAAYVEVIYLNVLNRRRDGGGFQYWLGFLENGGLSRGGVVRWIAAAPEFVAAHPY